MYLHYYNPYRTPGTLHNKQGICVSRAKQYSWGVTLNQTICTKLTFDPSSSQSEKSNLTIYISLQRGSRKALNDSQERIKWRLQEMKRGARGWDEGMMGSSCPGYVPPVETASHRTENEGRGQRAKCVRKTRSNVQHQYMRNKAPPQHIQIHI